MLPMTTWVGGDASGTYCGKCGVEDPAFEVAALAEREFVCRVDRFLAHRRNGLRHGRDLFCDTEGGCVESRYITKAGM
jgi:hypothetical protein